MRLVYLLAPIAGLVAASHWDPVLQGTQIVDEGLKVFYSVDVDNFPDAEAPDTTFILINGHTVPVKEQSDGSSVIAKDDLKIYDGCDCDLTLSVLYFWNGPPSDQKEASFRPVHVAPGKKPDFPKKNTTYAEAPSDLFVASTDRHRINVQWTNHYAPNTNHYGKLLFRIHRQGDKDAQQWDIDNGYTEKYTVGPWYPNTKYIISVKSGYSYGTGEGYSAWTSILWTAPNNAGDPIIGWHPWFSIGPSDGSLIPGSKVTALWSRKIHLDLFVVNKAGRVVSNLWEPNTPSGWMSWFVVGCDHPDRYCPTFVQGAKVTALWRSKYTHLDLFATDVKGVVWSTFFDNGWVDWFAISPETKLNPGAPIEAVWSKNEAQLDIFGTDAKGQGMWTWIGGGKLWAAWSGIYGLSPLAPGAPLTATWLWDYSRLHVYAVNTYGGIPHVIKPADSNDRWYIRGGLPYDKVRLRSGSQLVVTWYSGSAIVVGTDVNGTVWESSWNGNMDDKYQDWKYFAGQMAPGSDISITETGGSQIFGMNSQGTIYGKTHAYGTVDQWGGWENVRHLDKVQAGYQTTGIHSPYDATNGHVDMFVVGSDGQVWTAYYTDNYYE